MNEKLNIQEIASICFSIVDFNCDGKISFQEFIVAAISPEMVINSTTLELVFSFFDKENSGLINICDIISSIGIPIEAMENKIPEEEICCKNICNDSHNKMFGNTKTANQNEISMKEFKSLMYKGK